MDKVGEDRVVCTSIHDGKRIVHYVDVPFAPEEGKEIVKQASYGSYTTSGSEMDYALPSKDAWLQQVINSKDYSKIHVVISTGSGGSQAKQVYDQLLTPFLHKAANLESQVDCIVHTTSSSESISLYTKDIFLPLARAGIKLSIILLSGDGGVIDIVNGLCNFSSSIEGTKYVRPTLILLPLGTGNALANSTLITRDQTLGLSTLARGKPTTLPVFRASFSSATLLDAHGKPTTTAPTADLRVTGAVVASWGLHASLVGDSDTPEYRQHGSSRFQMAAKNLLFPNGDGSKTHSYLGSVHIRRSNEKDWIRLPLESYGYLVATLVSNLEKQFTISPQSKPLDGVLRIVYFAVPNGEHADQGVPAGGEGVMKIMEAAYVGGKHIELPGVGYEVVDALKITFDIDDPESKEVEEQEAWKWRRICIDGKIYLLPKGGSVTVERVTDYEGVGAVDIVNWSTT